MKTRGMGKWVEFGTQELMKTKPVIHFQTVSLEISGPDQALVDQCAREVAKEVERLTNNQLKRKAVRSTNQLYVTTTGARRDWNVHR